MTRLNSFAMAAAALMAVFAAPMSAQAGQTVEMNKTHLLRLPAPAAAVIIGNPKIADVSVHSDTTLFLMGRGFGETDILVLGAGGEVIMHTDINVIASQSPNRVTIIAPGAGRMSYDCAPYCMPAPVPGDDPAHIDKFASDVVSGGNGAATLSAAPESNERLSGGMEQPRMQNAESFDRPPTDATRNFNQETSRSRGFEPSTRSFQSSSEANARGKGR